MRKLSIIILSVFFCLMSTAMPSLNDDSIKGIEEEYYVLLKKQKQTEQRMHRLYDIQKCNERTITVLKEENIRQSARIDSLLNLCEQLQDIQSSDRKDINDKINITDDILQNRTISVILLICVIVVFYAFITFLFNKRIKSGIFSLDKVKKTQDEMKKAQEKLEEDSLKLDNKLMELFDRQLSSNSHSMNDRKPDHTFTLKVADEIIRIELNMSRMDSSIKGYKQLKKAVERIKDNLKANGYEIVDMLGKSYNDGMKVIANFIPDETLPEGSQIITGIIKPQINYNGQMIQAAQITVSQNI